MKNKSILIVYLVFLKFTLLGCSNNINQNNSKDNMPTLIEEKSSVKESTSSETNLQQENDISHTPKITNKDSIKTELANKSEDFQKISIEKLESIKKQLVIGTINAQEAESQVKKIKNNPRSGVETITAAHNLIMDLKQREIDKQDNILESKINDIETSFSNEEISEYLKNQKIYNIKNQILNKKLSITKAMIKEEEEFKEIIKSKAF